MAPDSKAILDNLAESLIALWVLALWILAYAFFVLVFFDSILMDVGVQNFYG